jgi:hypothetical protein
LATQSVLIQYPEESADCNLFHFHSSEGRNPGKDLNVKNKRAVAQISFSLARCVPFRVRSFCINLRLAKGNDKTRLQLKQLSKADLSLRQDLYNKTLSMAAQTDIVWATARKDLTPFSPMILPKPPALRNR